MNPDVEQLMEAIKRARQHSRQSGEDRLQATRMMADPAQHLEAFLLLQDAYSRLARALWHSLDASSLLLEQIGKEGR